jgi:hypothetical protein
LELRHDRVPGLPDPGPFKKYVYVESYGPIAAGIIRVFDEKLDAQTFMHEKGDARNRIQGKPAVEPGIPGFLDDGNFRVESVKLPAAAYYPGLRPDLRADDQAKLADERAAAEKELAASRTRLLDEEKKLEAISAAATASSTSDGQPASQSLAPAEQAALDSQRAVRVNEQLLLVGDALLNSLKARIAADDAKYLGQGDASALAQIARRAEKQADYEDAKLRHLKAEDELISSQRMSATDANAAAQQEKAKQEVAAARSAVDAARTAIDAGGDNYTPLSPIYPSESTGRRLALAKWIASSDNPLTARVAVNHIWMRHFGRGLVETPNNFGRSGRRPSHPELLDWLAVELMENGWRMKHIHRLIVTSATYRRSSHLSDQGQANLASDPDNLYYWHSNTRRLEAESVRDSLLACAGELDRTLGGQELDSALGMTSRRRSLYFAIHAEGKMQFLETFDAPDVCDCYQRPVSVRPHQALALANSELGLEMSRILAAKLSQVNDARRTEEKAMSEFITAAFETILSRPPTETERQAAVEFLNAQLATLQASDPNDLSAKLPEGVRPPSADLPQRAREIMIHALYNHNDFVTVR